jgi:two-component system phosphate regulon response regulator PhoB
LKKEGFTVFATDDGFDTLQLVRRENPAVLLLDLMIPGLNGLQVCQRLKADQSASGMSIIMVSACDAEDDVLRGLECGADDYVRKPFKLKEIIARVRTVLRRSRPFVEGMADEVLSFPPLTLNQASHEVFLDGVRLALTATEYRLLRFLMAHPERVFDRAQLLRQISDHKTDVIGRNIDVHIRSIRRKLAAQATMIDTARGAGYRFLPVGAPVGASGLPVAAP